MAACLLAIALTPLLLTCMHAHPFADDYDMSTYSNFWKRQAEVYMSWTGNVAGTLLSSLNPWHWQSLLGYRLALGSGIIIFFLSVLHFINAFLKKYTNSHYSFRLLFGAVLLLSITNVMPTISEGFYWYTGVAVYLLPFSLTLYVLCALGLEGRSSIWWFILLAIGSSGSPLQMVINGGVLFFITTSKLLTKKKPGRIILLAWIAVLIPAVIIIASPGNAIRNAYMPTVKSWSVAASLVGETYRQTAMEWMRNGSVLLYLFVILLGLPLLRISRRSFIPIAAWVAVQVVCLVCLFMNTYITQLPPTPRVVNIIVFIELLSLPILLAGLFLLFISENSRINFAIRPFRILMLIASVLLFVYLAKYALYRPNNLEEVIKDLANHTTQSFDDEMQNRYQFVRSSKAKKLVLMPLGNHPKALYSSDLGKSPKLWLNSTFSTYWGIDAVSVDSFVLDKGFKLQSSLEAK
ncbi:MAG: DUF6056 family protein [Bacteroidota bacterium]